MSSITVEYALNMNSKEDEEMISKLLDSMEGVEEHTEDWKKQLVLVKASLTSVQVAEALEQTGKQVRIRGLGNQDKANLGAAVCILQTKETKGVVRFIQLSEERVLVEATVHGLSEGKHGLHIYKTGNISNNGELLSAHYNPKEYNHGHPEDKECHAGDLGNLEAGKDGKANYRVESSHFSVPEIIGRSIGVTEAADDLGKEDNEGSRTSGNSGRILVCGVIARSAGLFQNPKKICLCSGATIWEEDKVG
eukprot:CAMPEP_0206194082 /NCGR_PEP_ID=MMETSP0166-20121206/6978_1 /ASSEMBLY_ACC=CAM_ASM_000260 /TAXON_ID=95228 /ORGANISM="Vannella robusta, Strain DIVA3 518/3/11/1/6" /LENGTH=249 /DNA_ID=CAMNT_0053610973 /DNA_START=188 /DNA_END=933 /DNA_ORIENTATION=-